MSASILVAIDLSHAEESAAILRRAAAIADLDGAALSVITVAPDYGSSFVATFFEEGTIEKAAAHMNDALHDFVRESLGERGGVRHVVGIGSAYDEVLSAAEKVGADLVIMGAAKPGAAANVLGPNAARVARHFSGSVLIHRG